MSKVTFELSKVAALFANTVATDTANKAKRIAAIRQIFGIADGMTPAEFKPMADADALIMLRAVWGETKRTEKADKGYASFNTQVSRELSLMGYKWSASRTVLGKGIDKAKHYFTFESASLTLVDAEKVEAEKQAKADKKLDAAIAERLGADPAEIELALQRTKNLDNMSQPELLDLLTVVAHKLTAASLAKALATVQTLADKATAAPAKPAAKPRKARKQAARKMSDGITAKDLQHVA